jgi:hypothetical protein
MKVDSRKGMVKSLAKSRRRAQSRLKINSVKELLEHEKEIVARIAALPNGGNFFMAHPFLLLADIGVELSESTRTELVGHDPYLTGLSETPYKALKGSREQQQTKYHVRGLFKRRAK